jgi:hypothetical protein
MSDDTTGESSESPPRHEHFFPHPALRYQDLDAAEVVRAADFDRSSHAESDHWFVLVDDHGTPVGAVGPERAEPSMVIVADADLPVGAALDAEAFEDAEPDTGVVVIERDSRRVLGVWSGAPLTLALQQHVSASWNYLSALPGGPNIPFLARPCSYLDDAVTCDTVITPRRKPAVMPPCANDKHLTAHDFVW